MFKQPHPHLLQAQYALALLSSNLLDAPALEVLPRTIAPHDHPPSKTVFELLTMFIRGFRIINNVHMS